MKKLTAVVCACCLALPAAAQDGWRFDGSLSYSARDEITNGEGSRADKLDNDLFHAIIGVSRGLGDGRMRGALEVGMRNEDFGNDSRAVIGAELSFSRRVGNQRYGLMGRLRDDPELSTTTELGYAAHHLGQFVDLRGMAGVQLIADADAVPGRDESLAPFGQAELVTYLGTDFAVSGGVYGDPDGSIFGFGAEWRPVGSRFTLFLDYAEAFDEYRGVSNYDRLTAGIRLVPGAGNLREARQGGASRLFGRLVEVQ